MVLRGMRFLRDGWVDGWRSTEQVDGVGVFGDPVSSSSPVWL